AWSLVGPACRAGPRRPPVPEVPLGKRDLPKTRSSTKRHRTTWEETAKPTAGMPWERWYPQDVTCPSPVLSIGLRFAFAGTAQRETQAYCECRMGVSPSAGTDLPTKCQPWAFQTSFIFSCHGKQPP